MASFKYDVRLDEQQFALAVVKELKQTLRSTIDRLLVKIRPSLVEYIENKLRKDPSDTYYSLDIGQLSCLLYTSPSPRDRQKSRMPSSA